MDKYYYYSRMTKQCIEKTISDIDDKEIFPDLSSSGKIWNMPDDKSDEEESSSNFYIEISDNL